MILLSRVGELFEDGLQTFVDISNDSMFCESAGVPSYVGLEYMAQTVAAYAGYRAIEKQERVKEGFLLGTREVTFAIPYFSIGSELEILCKDFMSNNEMGVFTCEIFDHLQKTQLGSCKLNVFQPENPQDFFQTA